MSVVEGTIPEQRVSEGRVFPLVYVPASPEHNSAQILNTWISENKEQLDAMMVKHGAVLFRGFDLSTPQAFADAVEASGAQNLPYVGGAAVRRSIVGDRVFTTNESPPSEVIPFHHEMAQVPKYPFKIYFYCEVPAAEGGETPILLSHNVYKRLQAKHPQFIEKLETLGVKYIRTIPEDDDASSAIGRGWKSTYLTDNREEAERKLKELGTSWEWLPNGNLKTITATLPAIKVNPRNGEKIFFNSIVAAYVGWVDSRNEIKKAVQFGDGSALDADAMESAIAIMEDESCAFKWQTYDAIFIDNHAAMHARKPFTPPRRILASLAQ